MNEEVSSVTFTGLPDIHGSAPMKSVTDTWCALTEQCPNLQKLVCDDFYTTKGRNLVMFFSFALHFSNLHVLEVPDLRCNDVRLELIADNLPRLRYILFE